MALAPLVLAERAPRLALATGLFGLGLCFLVVFLEEAPQPAPALGAGFVLGLVLLFVALRPLLIPTILSAYLAMLRQLR
jgi:hypothetical protein